MSVTRSDCVANISLVMSVSGRETWSGPRAGEGEGKRDNGYGRWMDERTGYV